MQIQVKLEVVRLVRMVHVSKTLKTVYSLIS